MLLWGSTVAFAYLKVNFAKCLYLLPVVLVLLFWSWSCNGLKNFVLFRWPSITEWETEMYITAHSAQGVVSEMTYTVLSGTLNSYSTIPYLVYIAASFLLKQI